MARESAAPTSSVYSANQAGGIGEIEGKAARARGERINSRTSASRTDSSSGELSESIHKRKRRPSQEFGARHEWTRMNTNEAAPRVIG